MRKTILFISLLFFLIFGPGVFAEEEIATTQVNSTGTVSYSGSGNNITLNLSSGNINGGFNTNKPTTWPIASTGTTPTSGQISQINISGTVTFTAGADIPTVPFPDKNPLTGFSGYTGYVGLIVSNSCTISGPGTLTSQNGAASSGSKYTADTITPLFINGPTTNGNTTINVNINGNLTVLADTPGFSHGGGCYLAVGAQGLANITFSNSTVTGLPAVMAIALSGHSMHNDDYDKFAQPGIITNIYMRSGSLFQTSSSYTDSTMAVVRTQGNDRGVANFYLNGGTVNGTNGYSSINNYAPGFYGASRGGGITVNSGTIEGYSGLLIRSGNVDVTGGTIIGDGPAPNDNTLGQISGSNDGNGGGIVISGSNHRYGEINIGITGGNVESKNYSAINTFKSQETNEPPYPDLGNDRLKVSGATFTGPVVPTVETSTGNGTNTAPLTSWADPTTTFKVTGNNQNVVSTITPYYTSNSTIYKVGNSYTANINTAQNISKQENEPVVVVGGSGQSSTNFDNLSKGKMIEASLTSNQQLSYFNINSSILGNVGNGQEPEQVGAMNLTILGTNATGYSTTNLSPENFNWTISSINSSSSALRTFANTGWNYLNGGATPESETNTTATYSGTRVNYGTNNDWALEYDFTWTVPKQTNSSVLGSFSFNNFRLVYAGGPSLNSNNVGSSSRLAAGVYQLSGTPVSGIVSNQISPSSINPTIRFLVNNSNTTAARITTANYANIQNPYTINLNNARTAQFAYTRTVVQNGQSQTVQGGGIANWSLSLIDSSSNSTSAVNYASVSQSGLVTVYRALPSGYYLELNLNVDGVNAQPVIVTTSGQLSYGSVTGITAVYNPLYLTQDNNFNLDNNLMTVPTGQPLTNGNVTFSSDNTNIIIFTSSTGDTIVTTANSNYTGTANITASWTDATGKTYTTTFQVTFVSQAVPATGITAKSTINLSTDSLTTENVNARLTPANNTVNPPLDGFIYTSSNTSVAVVDDYGNVTPVGAGTCTISSTYTGLGSNNTANTTVNVNKYAANGTKITLTPSAVYLVPTGTSGTTSASVRANLTPADSSAVINWSIDSDIATLTPNGQGATVSSTEQTGVGTITATITLQNGTKVTASTPVVVSSQNTVVDPVKSTISATSPDFYTVTVAPVVNPALLGAVSESIQKVSLFTWSQIGQTDMDCKVANNNGDGTYSYTFPVNDTPVNNYYIDASDIIVQAYASTDPNSDGNMVLNTTWNYANCGWTQEIIVTPYVQNTGFITPSVGNDAVAGTTGQAIQMEGMRLSTPIEGVDFKYNVHVENIGWLDEVSEGVYAGTMHRNLQIEAVHINLTGTNASQYSVQYQVHVQDLGWMNWVADGAEAGTTGRNLQMEAIRIRLVPVNTPFP